MKNFIHKFLDKKYSTVELIFLSFLLLGSIGIMSRYFGDTFRYTMGLILISLGIYGMIRGYLKEKKKNENR